MMLVGAPGRGADARIVDQDHLPSRGERIDQRRVPVVEVAAEMSQHQRYFRGGAETVVREFDTRCLDAMRFCRGAFD